MSSVVDTAVLLLSLGFWSVAIGFALLAFLGIAYPWWSTVTAVALGGALVLSYLCFDVLGR